MQVTKNEISLDKINFESLKSLVKCFAEAKVLVLGDVILDEYLRGTPERISREAPVIILQYINSRYALGGAANAAHNLAALEAKTSLMGVCGKDEIASTFKNECQDKNIEAIILEDESRPTTLKTRVVSSSSSDPDAGTVLKQQVLRIDRQSKETLSEELSLAIIKRLEETIKDFDIILLSDYASGILSEENSRKIIELANKHSKKIIVDSNGNFEKYCGSYCLTPNQPDVEATLGRKLKTEEDLFAAGKDLLDLVKADQILVTRGAKGMALFSKAESGIDVDLIPAFNIAEVFDVSGAGDTVSACFSLALALGASNCEAALLGNIAASIVVRKYGTAVTNCEELLAELEALSKKVLNHA
ncbi:MAG: bifunctional hydroxymethylpyrimidine kinase/phosphomethylpyrimidine kinase [Candidatus Caenarcaniphilales bacterium]|nr:bifunctional hydroxymethylpyrimidine kinase/phosphomethylpyrimidine kinase [Candidatus Caenarcaniphilales bacterium]